MKGARIGENAYVNVRKLQNIYPEMHSFLKVRKLLDEAEVFSNPYTEKLFTIMKKADKVLLVSF